MARALPAQAVFFLFRQVKSLPLSLESDISRRLTPSLFLGCPPYKDGHKQMAICVHCSAHTASLFVSYGPTNLLCTRCKACGQYADPYVEHEAVIVAIDLVRCLACRMTGGEGVELR